ncbi:transcriptional regulator [bacterium]|nr:transcriptional regulator [bacterium]
MKWEQLENDACPVARAMSVVGDRWTMLLIRDCARGVTRFEALQRELGVTRHILAGRLRKLVAAGVLEKRAYSDRPPRYDYLLTEKGRALLEALRALQRWGETWMPLEAATPRTGRDR